nr:PREDICTED: replication protein A 32 kDa subunit-like [Paralichthys olivaceus]
MWKQVCSQSISGITSHRRVKLTKAAVQILPCTVSQLLSAPQDSNDTFTICRCELNQVSVVGIIRGFSPFPANIQYSVDDMTGPLLNVKQWLNKEDSGTVTAASPGTYVKVTGSLRNSRGKRFLMATSVRCIKDLNEITSHMLEVVQAHMELSGKVYDVNMNTTLPSMSGRCSVGRPEGILPNGLSTIQAQVFDIIRKFSDHNEGISLHDLRTQLHYLRLTDIRSSLTFLLNEGHVFSTIDEHHFKSSRV